jgi:hypothetical protein
MAITISHTRTTMSIQLNFFFSIVLFHYFTISRFDNIYDHLTISEPMRRWSNLYALKKGGAPPTAALGLFIGKAPWACSPGAPPGLFIGSRFQG